MAEGRRVIPESSGLAQPASTQAVPSLETFPLYLPSCVLNTYLLGLPSISPYKVKDDQPFPGT